MIPKESTPLELGGETRYLRYSWAALERIEETFNIPIVKIKDVLTGENVRLKDIRNILWAGLAHDKDEGLSQGDVLKMLDGADLTSIVEKIAVALTDSLVSGRPAKKKQPLA